MSFGPTVSKDCKHFHIYKSKAHFLCIFVKMFKHKEKSGTFLESSFSGRICCQYPDIKTESVFIVYVPYDINGNAKIFLSN